MEKDAMSTAEVKETLEFLDNLHGTLQLMSEKATNQIKKDAYEVLRNDVNALTQKLLNENTGAA